MKNKMKVYIMGPKQLATKGTIPFYENIVAFTKNYFGKVVCTYPDFWESKRSPRLHYNFMKSVIKSCDYLIAEVSTPATGLGIELEMAVTYRIPVIELVREGQKASQLALGIPVLHRIITYKNQKDLNAKLATTFAAL